MPSSQRTSMTLVNRSDTSLKLYWLDLKGNLRPYSVIPPNGHVSQATYIGHNWIVMTGDLHCVGIFSAAPISIAFF